MKKVEVTKELRHDYTSDELEDMGLYLSEHVVKSIKLEAEKKETTKEFNDQIKAEEENIEFISRAIIDGFEMRLVRCIVEYNTDHGMHKQGVKTITRTDTNHMWVEQMLPNEQTLFNQKDDLPWEEE